MGRSLDDVMAGLSEERRQRIADRAGEIRREIEGLKALRKLADRSPKVSA